ncbi:hypothetical protein SH467x_000792 [Pirellulaceae bacterium SH467]
MKQHHNTLITNFVISWLLLLVVASTTSHADENPPFKVTAKRENDRVVVKAEKNQVVFSVHSPFGISHAVIERAGERWPDAVVLDLHLKGLEKFSASNGKVTIEASVSSQDGSVRLWMEGKEETPLDKKSPYWFEIQAVDSDGKPTKTFPLKDGCFRLKLPNAFVDGSPKTITLKWIDFYRN